MHAILSSPISRALIVCGGLALGFTVFSYRLIDLQVARHAEFQARADENHGLRQTIFARRGMIQDVHGLALAQNEPVKTVVADGSLVKDPAALAKLLAGPLGMSEEAVKDRLAHQRMSTKEGRLMASRYIVIKRDVPEQTATELAEKLAEAKVRAVFFEQDSVRVYPNGELMCHVVGTVNNENDGLEGVEKSMEQYLRGHDGFRYSERDRRGKEMVLFRQQERPARNGNNVRLTIDAGLQMIVEAELDIAVKQYKPKMATVVMMRPQTGEIMALANRPFYNLNELEKVAPEKRINCAVMSMVEPGSTFKIVTTAAALSQKLVTPETMVFCENGHFTYGGKTLHDHHPYGELSVVDILVKSSNVGAAKLGIQLGDQKLYEYVRRFGFGERTGVLMPGEIGGQVHPPHKWSKISITHVPMGHEVGVTPLQIVTAMSAIANGGHLMMPQIIHDVVDSEGNSVAEFPPVEVRRVIPDKTSAQLRSALSEVVSKRGTAQLAHVMGFKVAGKTGTAQKIGPNGTYEHGKYVVSFVGFMPAENPEFVCLVMLDDASTKSELNYGGTVAAPIFARIAEKVARHLNLEPTEEEKDTNLVTQVEKIRD